MDLDSLIVRVRSWDEFCGMVERLPTSKLKGRAFERLVQLYFIIDPAGIYRADVDPSKVWLRGELPEKVRTGLNLPVIDHGIDLIAETRAARHWAIQGKWRSREEGALTYAELATFVAESKGVSHGISHLFVVTNREDGPKLLKSLPDVTFLTSETWHGLGPGFFDAVRAFLRTKTIPRIPPRERREHQKAAVSAGLKHFTKRDGTRGKTILPCGAGKSLIAYWMAQDLMAKTTLVIVPSLALLRQTLCDWARESAADGEVLHKLVVASETPKEDGADSIVVGTHDLGVPAARPEELVRWFASTPKGRRVVFTTYASGPGVAEAARAAGVVFDFAVFDEAHHTTGHSNKQAGHLLDDENVDIRRRLFMTATERFYDGEREDVASMNDESIYGPTLYRMTFRQALDAGILSDYEVATLTIRDAEVASLVKKLAYVLPEGDMNGGEVAVASVLAAAIGLRRLMQKKGVRRVITFHNSVAAAKQFARLQEALNGQAGYGKAAIFHVNGEMPVSVRARVLRDFCASAEAAIITNARCLAEGVDLPEVDAVAFVDPRRGTIELVQGVGRALRNAPKKKKGYVLAPLVVGRGKHPLEACEGSSWESLIWILRRLAAHDERIVEHFQAIASGKHPKRGPVSLDVEVTPEIVDIESFRSAIEIGCWKRLERLVAIRPFEAARTTARELAVTSAADYKALASERLRALGLPTNPDKQYASTGWQGWADFLGNVGRPENAPRAKDAWLPFDEARRQTRARKFATLGAFKTWVRENSGCRIPINPHLVYSEEWKGGGDWIGLETARGGGWGTYENAAKWARGRKLESKEQWEKLRQSEKLRFWVPATPEQAYAGKGWVDWSHWLIGDTTDILARVDDTGLEDREVERAAGLRAGSLAKARRGKRAGKRGLSARCWARLEATLRTLV